VLCCLAVLPFVLLAGLAGCTRSPAGSGSAPGSSSPRLTHTPEVTRACLAHGVTGFIMPGGRAGDETVLGKVSVLAADYGPAVAAFQHVSWRYWQKRGLFIKAGTPPVTITVPAAWRNRIAFTWGTSNGPVTRALRLTACAQPNDVWDAYAGGFFLMTPAACVPLIFRIGSRTATVNFSIGRPCG